MPTVVLLEVDPLDDELSGRAPAAGLLPLAGHPMVVYAARAFRACGDVDAVVLAGPECYREQSSALAEFDGPPLLAETVAERVDLALDQFSERDELLFWPANAPLLTPAAVEAFLAHAPTAAGLVWSCVRAARIEQAFEGAVSLPSHQFGGDCLVLGGLGCVKPGAVADHRDLLRRIMSKLTKTDLAKQLGVGFAIKFSSGRATLADLMLKVSEVLGVECVASILPYAELSFRVRNRAEHHQARAWLEAR